MNKEGENSVKPHQSYAYKIGAQNTYTNFQLGNWRVLYNLCQEA